jgi:hypothetical protein
LQRTLSSRPGGRRVGYQEHRIRLSFKPAALLSLVLVVGIGTFGRAAAQGNDDPLVTLPGNQPAAVAKATPAQSSAQANASAASSQAQPITITIVLNRSDPAGFDAFVKAV